LPASSARRCQMAKSLASGTGTHGSSLTGCWSAPGRNSDFRCQSVRLTNACRRERNHFEGPPGPGCRTPDRVPRCIRSMREQRESVRPPGNIRPLQSRHLLFVIQTPERFKVWRQSIRTGEFRRGNNSFARPTLFNNLASFAGAAACNFPGSPPLRQLKHPFRYWLPVSCILSTPPSYSYHYRLVIALGDRDPAAA
jgi:hypothetical protein